MSFLSAVFNGIGSIVSGVMGNESEDKAADAQVQANRDAIALQRDQFNWMRQAFDPYIQRGNAAGDLLGATFGISPVNYSSNQAVPGANINTNALGNIGNIGNENGSGGYPPGFFAQVARRVANPDTLEPAPYQQTGQGNSLLTTGQANGTPETGMSAGSANLTATTPEGLQEEAYNRFLGSGYNQAATDISQQDFDTIQGGMGAAGKLFSGSTLGAMSDRLAGNRYGAYFDYNNALAGLAGGGQSATSSLAAGGQNATNAMSALTQDIGNIRGSSYRTQGANTQNMIGNALGSAGSFF